MVKDKIADLINGLKTASISKKETAKFSSSKLIVAILEVLKKEEYISDYKIVGEDAKKEVVVTLKYENGNPAINEVKRISHVSKRVYRPSKEIRRVRSGYGSVILSTPKGVLSGSQAKKEKVGGEALFEIW